MPHPWTAAVLGVAAAGVLTACAASGAPEPTASASGSPSGTALTVIVTVGSATQQWTVTCDPPGGTHPRPKSACDYLELARRWGHDPFAPVPDDAVCSQEYGGPQTATVTGTWRGRPIDATFSRTDGCEIGRWDDAVALLALTPDLSAPPTPSTKRT